MAGNKSRSERNSDSESESTSTATTMVKNTKTMNTIGKEREVLKRTTMVKCKNEWKFIEDTKEGDFPRSIKDIKKPT